MWRISGTKGLCNNVPTVDGPTLERSLNEKKIITDGKNSGGETGNLSTDEYANRELCRWCLVMRTMRMLMIVMIIGDHDYCEEDDDQNTDHNGDEQ